jgi:hypothetical protein
MTESHIEWEQPIGTIRGRLEEPGPRFVDPHTQEEREAIQNETKSIAIENRTENDVLAGLPGRLRA